MRIEIKHLEPKTMPDWLPPKVQDNPLLASILLQRGLDTPEKVDAFLNPALYIPTDPDAFPGMDEAVALILQTIQAGKRICVYGDYDVDGVTSTTILVDALRSSGADVIYHVPNRFTEGYGMHPRVVKKLAGDVALIVTCDCGISNNKEIALAKGLGMQVIVTDHHHLPETLPPADVIVTPKLLPEEHPAHYIPGAGMAYYLVKALLLKLERGEDAARYLDLVALAVVADVVPLLDENRYLLQQGLPVLRSTGRPGLRELMNICQLNPEELTEETIAFQLAPRLNAAGRMTTAELSVDLLLASEVGEAKTLARQLDQVNLRRKELGDQMREEALGLLGKDFTPEPIILYQPHWHEGILGITASKLCEDYNVPVLLMCLKEDGKTLTGSARSIPGLHIYDALKECEQFLSKFGGHAGAAGFSLTRDKYTAFEKSMFKILSDALERQGRVKYLTIDGELPLSAVDARLYRDVQKLAPFGEGNPTPTFLCRDTEVIYHRPTTDDKHLRLIVKHQNNQYPAIWWWSGTAKISPTIDLVYSIGLNRWRDKEELQLIVNQAIMKGEAFAVPAEARNMFDLDLEDRRNWRELGQELPEEPGTVYFYEELDAVEFTQVIHRYDTTAADTLVLLSCPPGLRVFAELILTVQPRRVVFAYSERSLKSRELFIKELLGLVKTLVTDHGGKTNIYELSTYTGEMENTVLVALKYLTDRGLIDFEFTSPDHLRISRGTGEVARTLRQTETRLQTLLEESWSFRKYMLKGDLLRIKRLLKGSL